MNQSICLEIIVSLKRKRYHAQTESFPNCKGIGLTKKEALRNLALKISRHISKITTESLCALLNTENYVEVLLDTEKEKEERLIFNLNQSSLNTNKNIHIKLQKIKKLPEQMNPSEHHNEIPSLENISPLSQVQFQKNTPSNSDQFPIQEDELLFGFPLSLN